ncbi:MAG: 5-formyltetrahydrofolate cyclo-ligase [Mongoliitalea sp.]
METKADFRKYFRLQRKKLSEEMLKEYSECVFALFKDFFEKSPKIKHVHVFIPMLDNQELDINPIINYLWSLGCVVYTSQMNYINDQMDTVLFPFGSQVVKDEKGIPYPKNNGTVATDALQLVLVPLLAFDRKGNRLGYGKGYYDKFFSQISAKDFFKLGISLFPPVDQLPVEEHDIPLDACIYPKGILIFGC